MNKLLDSHEPGDQTVVDPRRSVTAQDLSVRQVGTLSDTPAASGWSIDRRVAVLDAA